MKHPPDFTREGLVPASGTNTQNGIQPCSPHAVICQKARLYAWGGGTEPWGGLSCRNPPTPNPAGEGGD